VNFKRRLVAGAFLGDGGNVDAFRRRCRLDGDSGKMNFKKAALVGAVP
jgi:hypothetical protein